MDLTNKQSHLSRMLAELAAAGVSFRVESGQIRIQGTESPDWLPDCFEHNQRDLLTLLAVPELERVELFENRAHRHNELGNSAARR